MNDTDKKQDTGKRPFFQRLKRLFIGVMAVILLLAAGIGLYVFFGFRAARNTTRQAMERYKAASGPYALGINYDEKTGTITDFSTSRGFPMGGFGTGGFSIFTDGGLGLFRTNHNWFQVFDETQFPKGAFFAIWSRKGKSTSARILRGGYRGGPEYDNIKSIAHTKFRGRIPVFDLEFTDRNFPLEVSMDGFTSLIPHNVKDSSLPLGFFQLRISNPTEERVQAALMFSFENILGIGGSGGSPIMFPRDGAVKYHDTEKNYAEPFDGKTVRGLAFKTQRKYDPRDPARRTAGQYLIFTDTESLERTSMSRCTHWDPKKGKPALITGFVKTGGVGAACKSKGKGAGGAMSVRFNLKPGQERTVNFYLLWWTPYYVIERNQRIRKLTGRHQGKDYGHYYLNHFKTPAALAEYGARERDRLYRESRRIVTLVDASSLPFWLKTYVLNSTDSMITNSVLTRDGSFYTIEGMPWGWVFGAFTGTLDQRLASHVYLNSFFPSLDKNELLGFFRLTKDGLAPHGNGNADMALGTSDVPYGNAIKAFNETNVWVDLPQSGILQLGKTVLQTGDIELLRSNWGKMTQMMEYLDASLSDHLPQGITTYDYMHYKPDFVYSAIMQCATLKMMITLGSLLKEHSEKPDEIAAINKLLKKYEKQFDDTQKSYEKKLWNEKGYFRTCHGRDTIFTSALAGDWISRHIGLGPTADYERARSHSKWQWRALVDSYKFMKTWIGKTRPLVYREATPGGREMPAVNRGFKLYYVNNPWQSIAYQGVEAIYLNRVESGLGLIRRVWGKGWREGYPWDMDHWGMHGNAYMTNHILWLVDKDHSGPQGHLYMSHPSTWSVLRALTGASYNAFTDTLTFSPRKIPGSDRFRVPVFFPDFWLMADYDFYSGRADFQIIESFGDAVAFKKVTLQHPDGKTLDIPLDKPVYARPGARFTIRVPEKWRAAFDKEVANP